MPALPTKRITCYLSIWMHKVVIRSKRPNALRQEPTVSRPIRLLSITISTIFGQVSIKWCVVSRYECWFIIKFRTILFRWLTSVVGIYRFITPLSTSAYNSWFSELTYLISSSRSWTLADMYQESMIASTHPNRVVMYSGSAGILGISIKSFPRL